MVDGTHRQGWRIISVPEQARQESCAESQRRRFECCSTSVKVLAVPSAPCFARVSAHVFSSAGGRRDEQPSLHRLKPTRLNHAAAAARLKAGMSMFNCLLIVFSDWLGHWRRRRLTVPSPTLEAFQETSACGSEWRVVVLLALLWRRPQYFDGECGLKLKMGSRCQ